LIKNRLFEAYICQKVEKYPHVEQLKANLAKTIAETDKINNENKFYLIIFAPMATLAIVAIIKIFF